MDITAVIGLIMILIAVGCLILLYLSKGVWLSAAMLWLTLKPAFYYKIEEGYAVALESGGKFFALASSQKDFGPVKAPKDLNWAIRSAGEKEIWPAYTDKEGNDHPEEDHTYKQGDFQWDRRTPLVTTAFGKDSGVIWMGIYPRVQPHIYDLRIGNYRTVKPTDGEVAAKQASVRPYFVSDGKGNRQEAAWLISWSEKTSKILLSDDVLPIPVDGVRIGTQIKLVKDRKGAKRQGAIANVLVFLRYRIREPYLFLNRSEDTFELIQNEMILHIRELCAGMSIEDVFGIKVTLQSDETKDNPILSGGFGKYMRTRYGVQIKNASFAHIEITGDAGDALTAVYIAQKKAEAEAIKGEGEGKAEYARLTQEGKAVEHLLHTIGPQHTTLLRESDVATAFANGQNNTNTVVFGFQPNNLFGDIAKAAAAAVPIVTKSPEVEKEDKEGKKDV